MVSTRHTLDLWEAFLVTLLVGLAAFAAGRIAKPIDDDFESRRLTQQFEETFGSHKTSQGPEEWLVRDFFKDRRNGVFVDVGASHYYLQSSTYFLETRLGWSGLAVDALPQFASDYVRYRPRTIFKAAFVSDRRDRELTLYVGKDKTEVSSADAAFTRSHSSDVQPLTVRTTTLDALLEATPIDRIDFLNMDIELHEPQALAGFDIAKYRPSLVCVEAHAEVRQQLLDYFAAHGYVVVGRYLRVDPLNLWFRPLTAP